MTIFALLIATMIVVALLVLLPAFRARETAAADRELLNVNIARERLVELEAGRESGEMSESDFSQARQELELSLATDLARADQAGRRGGKALLLVLVAVVPLSAMGLYLQLGSPQFLDLAGPGAGADNPQLVANQGQPPASVEEMIAGLEQRLSEAPNDPDGWYMLGRSYMSSSRYADAAGAYERLRELTGDHPAALVALADALAMTQQGSMLGRPAELINQALSAAPDNPTALWLAGQAAEQQGDHKTAVKHWLKALPAMAEQPELAQQLRTLIAQSAIEAGLTPEDLSAMRETMPAAAAPPAAPALVQTSEAAVRVRVRVAPALLGAVSPGDTVFVFARAVSGPPMPLAVGRYSLSSLPGEIVLDDSSAMAPALRISGFPEVKVQARIAKGGQPTAQPGDLQSRAVQVAVGAPDTIELVIDQVVP